MSKICTCKKCGTVGIAQFFKTSTLCKECYFEKREFNPIERDNQLWLMGEDNEQKNQKDKSSYRISVQGLHK